MRMGKISTIRINTPMALIEFIKENKDNLRINGNELASIIMYNLVNNALDLYRNSETGYNRYEYIDVSILPALGEYFEATKESVWRLYMVASKIVDEILTKAAVYGYLQSELSFVNVQGYVTDIGFYDSPPMEIKQRRNYAVRS